MSLASGNYNNVYADAVPTPSFSLSDRVARMIDQANSTANSLREHHVRAFGPPPARPESIGKAEAGAPNLEAMLRLLSDSLDEVQHITASLAGRV